MVRCGPSEDAQAHVFDSSLTLKIAFVSADFGQERRFDGSFVKTPGGSCHQRCVMPAQALTEFGGIETGVFNDAVAKPTGEIVPLDDQKLTVSGDWDVIVLQRWNRPGLAQAVTRARDAGQTVVFDIDDHYWAIHRSSDAHSGGWDSPEHAEALRAANLVTVSTPFLAEVVKGHGCTNVQVIRNMIDLRQWTRQPVRPKVETIGWVGVTNLRSGDLEVMGQSIRHFMRDHQEIRFIHGGHSPQNAPIHKILGIPKTRTAMRPMCPIQHYPKLWKGIDIALCPLSDVDFNRAKSALKPMQASAAGVPFIASPLPEYEAYGQGMRASTPDEWSGALDSMLEQWVRQQVADEAHDRVQAEDVSVRWGEWSEAYSQTALACG